MGRMYDSWVVCFLKSTLGWKQLSPLPLPTHLQGDMNNGVRVKGERRHEHRWLPLGWEKSHVFPLSECVLINITPALVLTSTFQTISFSSFRLFSFRCDCRFRKDHLIDFSCAFVTFAKLHLTFRCLLFITKLHSWFFLAVCCSQQRAFGRPGRFMQLTWVDL